MSPPRLQRPFYLVTGADPSAASDAEVARGLQDNAAWALSEAWRRFAPMVIVMASRALGSDAEGEDLAQDVFYKVFRKAKTLEDPSKLRSFIFSFAIRVLKTGLRRKRARRWLSFQAPGDVPEVAVACADVESRDLLKRFYGLLDRLGSRDRLAFALRHLERMTVEEVAETMELSVSTVKRSLTHSTGKLSRWVQSDLGMVGPWEGRATR